MNVINLSIIFVVLLLVSCNSDNGSSVNNSNGAPQGQTSVFPERPGLPTEPSIDLEAGNLAAIELNQQARKGFLYTGTLLAAPLSTVTPVNFPSWLSYDSANQRLTGIPNEVGTFSDIFIKVSNETQTVDYGPFSITVATDPFLENSWAIENTGQSSFAQNSGLSGSDDMNVLPVWEQGISGKNVLVLVSDTGVELNHEDLALNTDITFSKNYDLPFPYFGNPTNSDTSGDHGTSMSGIIAGVGWNGIGGRGIAPDARIAGANFVSSSQSLSFLLDQASGNYDIFNYSYGTDIDRPFQIEQSYIDVLRSSTSVNRDRKGSIFVKSAGNSFRSFRSANADPDHAYPYFIVTAAYNANGVSASYSSAGSSIWVTAPGGEFGITNPAIITTDQTGCDKGFAVSSSTSSFNQGESGNADCNYVSTFNGTSSAAGFVSGAVALLLEANPNLTWRDIKYILASTSNRIDPDIAAIVLPNTPTGHIYEDPWIVNAAGFQYHNWYGFGSVDAQAAVEMAQNYNQDLGEFRETNINDSWTFDSGTLNLPIPDFNAEGVSHSLNVSSSLTIESVQIRVNATHSFTGDLGIELTSPSGTKSILFNVNNSFRNHQDLENFIILSNAFYGESANGEWTIRLIDAAVQDSGALTNWSINIYGH